MIYLASQSPRRRELLRSIGVNFIPLPFRSPPRTDAALDETPLAGELPQAYACRVARAKALHGRELAHNRSLQNLPVLAADTTLDVDDEIIGKPLDAADARKILRRLSARAHRVITAVALAAARSDDIEVVSQVSVVRFRPLEDAEIARYIASGEPFDKAGAYGIQGRAAVFVEHIEGSHSGIMGLPLCETLLLLRRAGLPL